MQIGGIVKEFFGLYAIIMDRHRKKGEHAMDFGKHSQTSEEIRERRTAQ